MSTTIATPEIIEPIKRLTRDLATAAKTLTTTEARFLVDAYYSMQHERITANNQIRAMGESEEPHSVIEWLAVQHETLENQVKRALDKWTDSFVVGQWAKSVCGIGPVIAAGLAAHIDITKAETAGSIWSFAGLSPDVKWEKGQKRPYNASLKTLVAFKLGESFVKVQGNKNDVYGQLFRERKDIEIKHNQDGAYAEIAKNILETKRIGKATDAFKAYSVGQLPPAHIHARARRWTVKIFLSHYHEVAYFVHHGKLPPHPYALSILGHAHMIHVPNAELIDGLVEARKAYNTIQ